MRNVLIIRLGALGDMVHSFGAFAAIRAHHGDARITLLTTAPYAGLLRQSGWFDEIILDRRPPWWDVPALLRLRRVLRGRDMIYDLQTSRRSGRYFRLAGRPRWSGIAPGCSHPHRDPGRDAIHTVERQQGQLRDAGITQFPAPDLGFLRGGGPALPPPYAVLVPGTSGTHGGAKAWGAENYAALGRIIAARGQTPVLVGGPSERASNAAIAAGIPGAIDLTGKTDLLALSGVLSRAACVVGGDTGPVHLGARLGAPTIVLYGPATDPAQSAPRKPDGGRACVLREMRGLAALPPARVAESLPPL